MGTSHQKVPDLADRVVALGLPPGRNQVSDPIVRDVYLAGYAILPAIAGVGDDMGLLRTPLYRLHEGVRDLDRPVEVVQHPRYRLYGYEIEYVGVLNGHHTHVCAPAKRALLLAGRELHAPDLICAEIATKGDKAHFKKTDWGMFAFNG